MKLDNVKHLSFELGARCNLSHLHPWCPSNSRRDMKSELGAQEIQRAVMEAVQDLGFHGFVGFHYYNEPLLYADIIAKVIAGGAYGRFMLWTNGLLLKEEHARLFQWIVITDYRDNTGRDLRGEIRRLRALFPETTIQLIPERHDGRANNYDYSRKEPVPCFRPNLEIPIDCRGDVHLCCQDWKGEARIGNIRRNSLAEILAGGEYAAMVEAVNAGSDDVAEICRRCRAQIGEPGYRLYTLSEPAL